jgi:hypothetical protein
VFRIEQTLLSLVRDRRRFANANIEAALTLATMGHAVGTQHSHRTADGPSTAMTFVISPK